MKLHLFNFAPNSLIRVFWHVCAGLRLTRYKISEFKRHFPAGINSMTTAANFAETIRGMPLPRTIIDVGANISQMTRLLLLSLSEGTEIISFEPNSSLKPLGKVFYFGLSDYDGEATFFLPADSTWATFVNEKVKDLKDDNPKQIKTKLRRFDSLLKSGEIDETKIFGPILLKIDAEASELQVLRGFGEYLDKIDYVLMEITNPKSGIEESALFRVPDHLAKHGFNAGQILYAAHHGSAVPDYLDVLFWRRK